MKHVVLNILLFFALIANAQDYKRASIWYFGENAGLDFNTEPPTALLDGMINTIEGCASICDTSGNLLFYTDGRTVWNKNHDTMFNGTGLFGDASSTQATIIIPYPDNDSLFYILTTRRGDIILNTGLFYHLVNIRGNNNTGELLMKNKRLLSSISEKLASTHHRNNRDYWVTTTDLNGSNLYSFFIGISGIVECPIVSSTPIVFSGSTAVGAMKFSPSGRLLAIAKNQIVGADVLVFDNLKGEFKFLFNIDQTTKTYGIEFSPSENYLYIMERNASLLQFSLKKLTQTDVINSKQVIYTVPTTIYDIQALQLGVNNKIYVSRIKSKYLWVINNPDTTYNAVNFDTSGIYLGGKNSSYGLPAMVSSFLYRPILDFSYSLDCETNQVLLAPKNNLSGNYNWDISKSGSGSVFTANTLSTNYTFQDTGWFDVELKVIGTSDTLIVKKQLHIKPVYKLNLGNDTTLCLGQSLILNAGNGQNCYLWQDSSTSSTFLADTAGAYYVRVFSQNLCIYYDTITISYSPNPTKPTINSSNDTLYSSIANSYQWFKNGVLINGATLPFYKPTQNGFYQVMVANTFGCSALSDSFQVKGLSIQNLDAENYFDIYPIPTNNTLFIENKHNITLQSIRIKDIAGRIFSYTPNTILSLEALANGIYYLELVDTENNHFTTKIILN